ncbi:unnamed protein product [Rotaria sp. Silwood2]|nr:unnamed protein product [Rotaria sp. Silwood2]CAF2990692.1 unnamed protein product [Rotaria sp. Silwood2]CAF3209155.1 unnamed protein product [Rotaria sp. Silwood2]CAF4068164.1 unnamed protein product [Rotaria sp. Silwood2]CAF4452491.1 unnamed protein product [Rotaria sp. Silwood2]
MTKMENNINHLVDNLSAKEDRTNQEICDHQLEKLHTLLCYRTTCRRNFRFYADRLRRLIVKAVLDQLL